MLEFSAAILTGLLILVWSADRFVTGAVGTALKLGMTPMMVGLTVVAFGTSAPELMVSVTASLNDASNLAVGNAIGSNIANIGLVLGITALVSPIPLKSSILKVEFPVLLIATLLGTVLIWDGHLDFIDGLILLLILLVSLSSISLLQKNPEVHSEEIEEGTHTSSGKAYSLLIFSLILLLASSKLLVWGATGIAETLGISDLVIGLTIVAIGTSLPELAASIASALRGHHDLALGNVIGSNLFNLLAVLAIPALINPPTFDRSVIYQDYTLMLILTGGLAVIAYVNRAFNKTDIGTVFGLLLLTTYLGYLAVLYQQSTLA